MVHRIAIIGGGFSGAMVLAHIANEATAPLKIDWYDASGLWARGTAYGRAEESHLLNVRADRMGAYAENPAGFWEWVQNLPDAAVYRAEDFLPRKLYGEYVHSVLQKALAEMPQRHFIRRFEEEVKSLEDLGQLDAVVLATGNLPPRQFAVEGVTDAYIANSWEKPLPRDLSNLVPESCIGIIGTGLTGVDAVLSVIARGFKGKILMFSRHGWLPQEHRHLTMAAKPWDAKHASRNVLGLMVELRRRALKEQDWRNAVDALRPATQAIWQQLPAKEKTKFFRRLFSLWNIHRHRMAPQIGRKLAELQQDGKLEIMAVSLTKLQANAQGIEVNYRMHGKAGMQQVALLMNCTGPEYYLSKCSNPLLRDLLDRKIIRPDETGTGLALDENGAAAKGVYPLGTLTVGTYLETTAVPELRAQAQQVARTLLAQLQSEANR